MDSEGENLSWFSRLRERSLQDLLAIYMRRIGLVSGVAVLGCYVYDPSMKLLLYAAVPAAYQNWLSFCVCYVAEIQHLMMLIGTGLSTWQLQVMSFDLVTHKLESIVEELLAHT